MRWAQVSVCVLGSFIFPNWQSFAWNYVGMRTVHWTGIHIHCSLLAVFNVRSRLPEAVFRLRQSCKSGRARAQVCQNVSGRFRVCIQNLFITLRVTIFFFRDVHLLCPLQNFCEWSDCDFLQLILFANTDAFFCSLRGLASNSFWKGYSCKEISTRWLCVEIINHSRDVWLVLKTMAHKSTFHAYSTILDSFFYAYSAMVDSFVIILCFEKHYIPQYYRWLTR